jgi:hypothetical protein
MQIVKPVENCLDEIIKLFINMINLWAEIK